jgi:uncharacterized protein with FMN-binding domain
MRRAIVSSTATVSGILLLLGLKSHGATTAHAAGSFSIGSDSGTVSSPSAPSSSDSSGGSSSGGTSGGTASGGTTSGGTTSGGSSNTAPSTAPSSSAAKPPTVSASKTITGDAAPTRYGPVQLQVTFNGTRITRINVIDYPTESGRDQQINSYALPILNQEAMAAQSAQVDVVSGATYTSDGYAQSLQSAIDKAKA